MLSNTTKAKLDAGEVVLGTFIRYHDPSFTEYVALQGWDFLVFDGEHGTLEPHQVENLVRAAELRGVTPVVRVPTNQPHLILRYLDTGAHGVHVPWVNTPAEVDTAVRSVKYHPRGIRGLAGSRAGDWGITEPMSEYTARSNRETLVVIHIETQEAVDAVADYLAVDGVDVIFLGPTDLSQSLGVPGELDHPQVVEALEQVADVVVPSEKALGVFAGDLASARRWIERGARYVATDSDRLLRRGMQEFLNEARR
ncbi:MAG TPA: aldolase/citrate lyase family protein [Acidimicrobiia bacterium]|nr:aldolase/citrate lyase family protein [Acidimicrobiia bacterium]